MVDIQSKLMRKLRETVAKRDYEDDDGPDAQDDGSTTGELRALRSAQRFARQQGKAMADIQAKLMRKLRETVGNDEHDEDDRPDPRDAKIAQLEHALEAEREHSTALRKTIDEQCFRLETLERSYAKQLDDARQRARKAEEALANEKTRAAELEAATTKLTSERDKAHKELDHMTKRQFSIDPAGPRSADRARLPTDAPHGGGLSIDELLAEASVVDPKDQAAPREPVKPSSIAGRVPTDDELLEDMLSPDLVFTGKDADAD